MKKYILAVFCIVFTLALSSCASTTGPLSNSARQQIHTVSVNPDIPVPSIIEYAGPHMIGAAVLGGIVGQGIAYASESSTREALLQTMSRSNIKLNFMLYQSFVNELKDQTSFEITHTETYDAQFKIVVLSYGFSDGNHDNHTIPFINVNVSLVNSQGKVIWQFYKEEYLNSRKFYGYNIQDYVNNQILMKKAYMALMTQTADDAISSLMD